MRRTVSFVAGLAIFGTACALVLSEAEAQKVKGKTRPLTTAQLMAGLVKVHCGAVKDGLAKPPATDDDWKGLATAAALLNESSYTLMDDGRCPDAIWKDASMQLRTGSQAVLDALAKQDVAAAQKGFEGVLASCKACHAEHKYKKAP